jgi:hypothetical protein
MTIKPDGGKQLKFPSPKTAMISTIPSSAFASSVNDEVFVKPLLAPPPTKQPSPVLQVEQSQQQRASNFTTFRLRRKEQDSMVNLSGPYFEENSPFPPAVTGNHQEQTSNAEDRRHRGGASSVREQQQAFYQQQRQNGSRVNSQLHCFVF